MTASEQQLLQEAQSVLRGNWVSLESAGGFSKPAAEVYPYQWNWDAAFAAIGYAHTDIERAMTELRSLFAGQWDNGMLPHIVFHTEATSYFPDEKFWQSDERNNAAPHQPATSGLTQPPVQALAVWHIYQQLKEREPERAERWLAEMYPKLLALHRYFYVHRDQDKTGLVTIYHPWESGMDNSPRWDAPLDALEIDTPPTYQRRDTDFVDARFRPTDDSYNKYVYLAESMRALGYDDERLQATHPFQVEDIFLSAVLHLANERLIDIANVLGRDTAELTGWHERLPAHLTERCWSDADGLFYDYDRRAKQQIPVHTIAAVAPMISGVVSERTADWLFSALDTVDFCGLDSCHGALLPSTSKSAPEFQPEVYWRGPVWINVNWLLWRGLQNAGHGEQADAVRSALLGCLEEQGIWEYYSPVDGAGIGAHRFTWSAALAIDLLESH